MITLSEAALAIPEQQLQTSSNWQYRLGTVTHSRVTYPEGNKVEQSRSAVTGWLPHSFELNVHSPEDSAQPPPAVLTRLG